MEQNFYFHAIGEEFERLGNLPTATISKYQDSDCDQNFLYHYSGSIYQICKFTMDPYCHLSKCSVNNLQVRLRRLLMRGTCSQKIRARDSIFTVRSLRNCAAFVFHCFFMFLFEQTHSFPQELWSI